MNEEIRFQTGLIRIGRTISQIKVGRGLWYVDNPTDKVKYYMPLAILKLNKEVYTGYQFCIGELAIAIGFY